MVLDAYSLCPGGTGKKIKFCCSDLSGELQKIDRMMDGRQFEAALSHIERLEAKYPGRACLMNQHCTLLFLLERSEEANAIVEKFLERYPENPLALANYAMTTLQREGGRAALSWIQRAAEKAEPEVQKQFVDVLTIVGRKMALEQEFLSAQALMQHAQTLERSDVTGTLLAIIRITKDVPIWVKAQSPLSECPGDVPWKRGFDEAVHAARNARWELAERRLREIAAQADDAPCVWRNMALLRSWLADREGSIEAYWKYSRLDVPLDDAVEAAATAMFLSGDYFGDEADMLNLVYPIVDVEGFKAAAASSKQFYRLPGRPVSSPDDDSPPPLEAYVLTDQEWDQKEPIDEVRSVPRVLCFALFFGKQTDREARIELIPVFAADEASVNKLLNHILFGVLGPLADRKVIGRHSYTQVLCEFPSPIWPTATAEQQKSLRQKYYEEVLLKRWPDCPLGVLDGKTPREAAQDPQLCLPLLGAICLLESMTGFRRDEFDFNRLRAELGLPTVDPIDPKQVNVAEVPVSRLERVMVENLNEAELFTGFTRAGEFRHLPAMRKFLRELVAQPKAEESESRLRDLGLMIELENSSEEKLFWVNKAREIATCRGESDSKWDLIAFQIHLHRGDFAEASEVFNHVAVEHSGEPLAAAALRDIIERIRRDLSDRETERSESNLEDASPMAVPGDAGPLWTPDSEMSSGEKPKLWTPGMP